MPGQVMEAPLYQQLPPLPVAPIPPNCKHDATTTEMAVATAAADVSCLQQPLPASANAAAANGGREQCPRCASHDTKFCYYNNYNTSQPRHFCRACRRYWTLGGSLRNVPIGGSTRKRPRMAPPAVRRPPVHFGAPPLMPPPAPSQQGLLGSLFALGTAPLLEGRVEFDLGLGLPGSGQVGHAGAGEVGLHGLGLRGGSAGTSTPLLWPTGLLENDSVDTWKVPEAGAGAIWPEFSAAAAAAQAGGLLHGGAQML